MHRILIAFVLCASFMTCSDDGPTGPRVVHETTVLSAGTLSAGVAAAEQVVGARNASQSPAQLANLGVVPREATGSLDLYQPVGGTTTTLAFDIDDDGANEDITVFRVSGGPALLAWRDGESCFLAYQDEEAAWYIDSVCAVDSAVVCRYTDGAPTCQLCDAENCAECTVDATDVRAIECYEIVAPEPDVTPDVSSEDTDVPDAPDAGDDTGAPDVETDTSSDTTEFDVGVESGSCDPVCTSSGAACCTTCGCAMDDCTPVCSDGFQWDCEVACCFNYDTFECES